MGGFFFQKAEVAVVKHVKYMQKKADLRYFFWESAADHEKFHWLQLHIATPEIEKELL